MKIKTRVKTLTIGKPVSPSKFGRYDVEKLKEILMTFGGGMGGSKVRLYCTEIKTMSNGFLKVILLEGNTKEINPKYIVSMEEISVLKTVQDTTEHSNYNKQTVNSSELTRWIKIPYGYEYKFSQEVQHNFKDVKDKDLIIKVETYSD